MRNTFFLSLLVSLLIASGGVIWRLAAYLEQQQLHSFSPSSVVSAEYQDQKRLKDDLVDLVGQRPGSADSILLLAELERLMSRSAVIQKNRVNHLCAALSLVGQALRGQPYQAAWLLNWANLRQVLGDFDCELAESSGDYSKVIDYALTLSPSDPGLAFSAGLVFFWAGERDQSLASFRRALTFGSQPTSGQLHFLAGLVSEPQDLLKLVPAILPQVLAWSRYFWREQPQRLPQLEPALAELQQQALNEATARQHKQELPAQSYYDGIMELVEYSANDQVRRASESNLARFLRSVRQPNLAAYLDQRSSYERLAVVDGSVVPDTRPLRNPLSLWDRNRPLAFDSYFNSIGFYSPANQVVALIELCAKPGAAWPEQGPLKVLVSNDNQLWNELHDGLSFTRIKLGDRPCLYRTFEGERFRYWKLHYGAAERRGKFLNDSADFIRVYGLMER